MRLVIQLMNLKVKRCCNRPLGKRFQECDVNRMSTLRHVLVSHEEDDILCPVRAKGRGTSAVKSAGGHEVGVSCRMINIILKSS